MASVRPIQKEVVMSPFQTKPYMLKIKEGKVLLALGAPITIKATSEQTGGAFNLFEIACPPGNATPLLIHYTEDVAIYVLEGTLAVFWGTEKKEANAGSFFYQPRGTPHGFRVEGQAPARILYLTVPAGFDSFMREHQLQAADTEREVAAARYKIEVLGPLPEQFDNTQKNYKRRK
jgi:quercetin dioxygenase-like cupin family protein